MEQNLDFATAAWTKDISADSPPTAFPIFDFARSAAKSFPTPARKVSTAILGQ